ncbi:unnamed protein product [Gordionus sp. m RMFG-2023]|uniref:carboxypeptidase B-like n=1 Tax=Gordionus sp. m RMFG-2023 TaxID=3053472 RepID=UPI0030E493E4
MLIQAWAINSLEYESLAQLQANHSDNKIWSCYRTEGGLFIDIMILKINYENFVRLLKKLNIRFATKMETDIIQKIIDIQTKITIEYVTLWPQLGSYMYFDYYPRYYEVLRWLDHLEAQKPKLIKVFTVGKSYEDKELKIIKIGEDTGIRKPAFYIEAGVRAREWASITTALYFISLLFEPERWSSPLQLRYIKELLRRADFYIMPLMNPDGYEYSFIEDRLWTKNRRPNYNSKCIGVDLDSNYEHVSWGKEKLAIGGVSYTDPCSDYYQGPRPFTEIETRTVRDFISSLKCDFRSFVTIREYGAMFLAPYAHTYDPPSNHKELRFIMKKAIIDTPDYSIGSISNRLFVATGSSVDWAYDNMGIKYSFAIELKEKENSGYLMPKENILKVAKDAWKIYNEMFYPVFDRVEGKECKN